MERLWRGSKLSKLKLPITPVHVSKCLSNKELLNRIAKVEDGRKLQSYLLCCYFQLMRVLNRIQFSVLEFSLDTIRRGGIPPSSIMRAHFAIIFHPQRKVRRINLSTAGMNYRPQFRCKWTKLWCVFLRIRNFKAISFLPVSLVAYLKSLLIACCSHFYNS